MNLGCHFELHENLRTVLYKMLITGLLLAGLSQVKSGGVLRIYLLWSRNLDWFCVSNGQLTRDQVKAQSNHYADLTMIFERSKSFVEDYKRANAGLWWHTPAWNVNK